MGLNKVWLYDKLDTILSEITHVAFFLEKDLFSDLSDDISTKHEIGRVAVTPTRLNEVITINYDIGSSIANCQSFTVVTATSLTELELSAVTALSIGDLIEIDLGTGQGFKQVKITNIASNDVTFTPSLPSLPTVGATVHQMIGQRVLIKSGTSSANTGTMIYNELWQKYKSSAMNITGNVMTFKGVGN